MIGIVGIGIVFVMVFGGYIAAGGKMGIILKALPFEMAMIGGAAAGAVCRRRHIPTPRAQRWRSVAIAGGGHHPRGRFRVVLKAHSEAEESG